MAVVVKTHEIPFWLGFGASPILEPILVVGLGCSLGGVFFEAILALQGIRQNKFGGASTDAMTHPARQGEPNNSGLNMYPKLTWNLTGGSWKTLFLLKGPPVRFHVN